VKFFVWGVSYQRGSGVGNGGEQGGNGKRKNKMGWGVGREKAVFSEGKMKNSERKGGEEGNCK